MVFSRSFDPYIWVSVRRKGRSLYFVDNGLMPGLVAAICYAALMMLFGSDSSPYLNAAVFALFTTPIYVWISYRAWEANEDALAAWVAERAAAIDLDRDR